MIKYIFLVLIGICTYSIATNKVDFDASLGKNDSYFGTYYTQCMSAFNKVGSQWAYLGTCPEPIGPLVTLCRSLYYKNPLPTTLRTPAQPKIPLKIHQIWLGSPFPDKYKAWQKTWQSMPGFEYKLWTDADVEKMDFDVKDIYLKSKNYGQRSDILRMVILEREGGMYIDTDFECISPEFFKLLHCTYDFYTGLHPLDAETFALENALIGSIPHHPIVKAYLKQLKDIWNKTSINDYDEVVIKTGPGLFTRAFSQEAGKKYKDIALPPTFFYPLGLHQWDFLKRFSYESIKAKVLKPESAAIHWWHGTWKAPQSKVKGSSKRR